MAQQATLRAVHVTIHSTELGLKSLVDFRPALRFARRLFVSVLFCVLFGLDPVTGVQNTSPKLCFSKFASERTLSLSRYIFLSVTFS